VGHSGLPDDVRAVWTEGLQRYVDRMAITEVAGTVNQWTFIINGISHFADGTGDARYADVVKRHVRWLLTRNLWNRGRQPAGYFDESEGARCHIQRIYQSQSGVAVRPDA
jgi:hypothetical protein